MNVAVIVPWAGGCPHREAVWRWLRARHTASHPDWPIIEGGCGEGPWRKGVALADAIDRSTAEVLAVIDADVWTDALTAAAVVCAEGAPWVVPRATVRRLTSAATEQVLSGAPFGNDLPLEENAYTGIVAGGAVVMRRETWQQVPLDRRFAGWGHEDEAWTFALTTVVGRPVQLDWDGWPLWHLWHPPQERRHRNLGSEANLELRKLYGKSRTDPDRMRQVIDEGRHA